MATRSADWRPGSQLALPNFAYRGIYDVPLLLKTLFNHDPLFKAS